MKYNEINDITYPILSVIPYIMRKSMDIRTGYYFYMMFLLYTNTAVHGTILCA